MEKELQPFDALLVNDTNQFAVAAGREMANAPSCAYNPLWLTGLEGSGKTTLLDVIYLKAKENGLSVDLICASELDELLDYYSGSREDVVNYLSDYDLVCIDELEYLNTHRTTLLSAVHIINRTAKRGTRVVLASQHPIPLLSRYIKGKNENALFVEIHVPDKALRARYAELYREERSLDMTEEALEYLLDCPISIGQLQGVFYMASLQKKLCDELADKQEVQRFLQFIEQGSEQDDV